MSHHHISEIFKRLIPERLAALSPEPFIWWEGLVCKAQLSGRGSFCTNIVLQSFNSIQALGFVALISAAACQGAVQSSSILLRDSGLVPASPTYAAGGWTIFISFWVMLYQALAIVQLFLHIKLAYKAIPVLNWSYFFLVVC